MYLFARRLTTMGSPRRTMPWATRITEHANSVAPLDIMCWSTTFGHPIGTFAWTTLVETEHVLADGTAALAADENYLDLVDEAADLVAAPGLDELGSIIHGSPDGTPPPIGAVASVTRATALVDRMEDALTWSIDIAQHVERVSGTPVAVATGVYGTMGDVSWIAIAPDRASVDANRAAVQADPDYIGRLAATGDLFIPGSGHVSQSIRIA